MKEVLQKFKGRPKTVAVIMLVIIGMVCVPILVKPMLPIRPGVNRDNFDRIVKGMTKAEVEKLFASQKPPIDERHGRNDGDGKMRWQWDANPDRVIVEFDMQDHVVAREWWNNIPDDENVFEMVYRVMRLRPAKKSITYHRDESSSF